MESRYDAAAAEDYVKRFALQTPASLATPEAQTDLALRVYTSQLLGSEPSLVLHGGGNTSVKTLARELTGRTLDCLCVKGSGWDLASIQPAGFPVCRLEPLLELCRLETLSDAEMVSALRAQMLDPSGPTPSVEALLHAFLPAKFIDHTHADAVLALVDQPDAEVHVRRVWGEQALFVPYIMPGFVLLRRIVELTRDQPPGLPMVLEKHGIFTWGASAKESYEHMIGCVTQAENYLAEQGAPLYREPPLVESEALRVTRGERRRSLALAVRGALARSAEGRRFVFHWETAAETLSLAGCKDAAELTQSGPLTPDHVIRTKQRPLFVASSQLNDSAAFGPRLAALLASFRSEYQAYFERGVERTGQALQRLDALPRVLLFQGIGALCVGQTKQAAQAVADIYRHTARVQLCASRLGRYQPVSEADLFEVEYWSLEQAKLKQTKTSSTLAGQVVVITGAARGIGLACAQRFLANGAHLVLADRDAQALENSARALTQEFGHHVVREVICDVTQPQSVDRMFQCAIDSYGGLDIVVSNAGTAPAGLLHETAGDQALRQSLDVNLLGHQNVARAATDYMLQQGIGGVLLFNASKSAFNPGPEFGPYAVAKAALIALMKQYAIDLGSAGIRTAAVNADRVRTELLAGGLLEARAKARGVSADDYFKLNLLARETLASDVADAFLWLATAQATTGATLPVDGGNPAAFPR